MIQEYTAFIVFLGAIVFSSFSVVRYLIRFKRTQGSNCAGNCNCKPEELKDIRRVVLHKKSSDFKHVRLK